MDDLLNLLPESNDLRKCARVMREAGHYEIAMQLDDIARYLSREERYARFHSALADREAFLQETA